MLTEDRDRWRALRAVVDAVLEKKGEDVMVLDVREVTSFADAFVIVTGASDRNVRAIVDAVEEAARGVGVRPLGIEGYAEGRWVLVDLNDVIVHVFAPEARAHYQLERLYADAPELEMSGVSAQGSVR